MEISMDRQGSIQNYIAICKHANLTQNTAQLGLTWMHFLGKICSAVLFTLIMLYNISKWTRPDKRN